jgi:hypothetical protein
MNAYRGANNWSVVWKIVQFRPGELFNLALACHQRLRAIHGRRIVHDFF